MHDSDGFPPPEQLIPFLEAVLALDPSTSCVEAPAPNKFAAERARISTAASPAGALNWLQVQTRR